jgi:hypothetical protein
VRRSFLQGVAAYAACSAFWYNAMPFRDVYDVEVIEHENEEGPNPGCARLYGDQVSAKSDSCAGTVLLLLCFNHRAPFPRDRSSSIRTRFTSLSRSNGSLEYAMLKRFFGLVALCLAFSAEPSIAQTNGTGTMPTTAAHKMVSVIHIALPRG